MLAGMSSAEFTEWMAYDSIEPIGAWRDDALTALLRQTMIAVFTDAKKTKPPTADKLLPGWWPQPEDEEPNPETVRLQARLFKQAFQPTRLKPGEKPPGWTGEIG